MFLVRTFLLWLLSLTFAVAADEIEFLNGTTLQGRVVAIHKKEREVEFEATIAGASQTARYPYTKIHRVVWKEKEYIVTKKASGTASASASNKRVSRTVAEVKEVIAEEGATPPPWLESTPLDYPKTLDLDWPQPAPEGWNNQKNVGQYIWDRINPNENRWRSGVRLMMHLLEVHQGNSELTQRVERSLGAMYFRFFQDYARAAYWWEKAGQPLDPPASVGLAECYFRLGNKAMATRALDKAPLSIAKIKLLGDMGDAREALKLAGSVRMSQPHELYLTAGDICRLDGKFTDAILWYEKVLTAPKARNEDYEKRYHARARQSIESVKQFELLDISKLADGTYRGTAMGYEGPLDVEARVRGGRIQAVNVTQHTEKQYYSALTDVPAQIIQKQSLKDVEGTSHATITAVAIINATAKALSGDPE